MYKSKFILRQVNQDEEKWVQEKALEKERFLSKNSLYQKFAKAKRNKECEMSDIIGIDECEEDEISDFINIDYDENIGFFIFK